LKGVFIIQKQVLCSRCKNVLIVSGNPGEVIKVTCPSCGAFGKVTFAPFHSDIIKEPEKGKVIETKKLTKKFGNFTAVKELNFSVYEGEIYGLIGPNGSGKTTIIKMLCGLLQPTKGGAKVLGNMVPCNTIKKDVGYMPQENAVYIDNTVHENLLFFGGIYGMSKEQILKREQEMLEFVDLLDWRDALVSTLSGGMRHRLSLACALIHEPHLVFLDEPTVGVDPELRATFWEYFEAIVKKGITLVITTHYMDEADHCFRVGLLRQGELIAEGKPQDLKQSTGTSSLEDTFLALAGRKKQ
jgi:ABC-2 type transport system ATP-binding protein